MNSETVSLWIRNAPPAVPLISLYVISLALLFLISSAYVNVYDEGIILTGALRVLNGEIPSRDFYTNYGPGQFYLLSAALGAFGSNLLVGRVYDSLIAATIPVLVWLLVRQSASRILAAAAAGLAIVLLAEYRVPLYPLTPATALVLLTALTLISHLAGQAPSGRYLPIAAFLGLLLLFRYDLAVIALPAFGLPFLTVLLLQRRQGTVTNSEILRTVVIAAGGVTAVFLAILGTLALSGILAPALRDLIVYNGSNYVAMRSLPFPGIRVLLYDPLSFVTVYLPLFAVAFGFFTLGLTAVSAFKRGERAVPVDVRLVGIIVLVSVSLFFYAKGLVRTSAIHMLISSLPSVPLAMLCVASLGDLFTKASTKRIGFRSHSVFSWFVLANIILLLAYTVNHNLSWERVRSKVTTVRWPQLPALMVFGVAGDRRQAAEYVVTHSPATARILSATGRHDKVFVNDVAFYFIANRLPGTRWHHYDPGVQTSTEVQEEMIRDLERNRVDLVLRDYSSDDHIEGNMSDESSGVLLLDNYLNRHFQLVASFGKQQIYRRIAP